MQSVFVTITKLIASKNHFFRRVFCNNFGRGGIPPAIPYPHWSPSSLLNSNPKKLEACSAFSFGRAKLCAKIKAFQKYP